MESLRSFLKESLDKYDMPFPVDKKVCSGWAKDLPHGGETIIFTSCMYQIEPVVPTLSKFSSMTGIFTGALKGLSSLAKLVKPSKEEIDRAYKILNNVVNALRRRGINPGYLYEDEPYSGALLLEAGLLEDFANHARRVASLLRDRGVKRVITVDPHTHNALTRYAEFVPFDVEVVNYLQLVDTEKKIEGEFTIHDSCLYSRFLDLRDRYRELISKSGIKLNEDFLVTGRETSTCCGGPIALINRDLSESIAEKRAQELNRLSNKLLVMCPICYITLSPHFRGEVKDIAEVIL
ncbi:Lactate utilization protein A [Metallosphaera sp. J1]|uniref:(Fe-S)-binding protein n=1 Tax=Metallosphaera javensis (ex Hofmann et al. 2022) TaxID=99938 RepID=UPI001EE0A761|nr:(Fe-S)-binding protein [Metallosphaera javensis (ex Hofmann et al. 2022)]MCG3108196.1 Lactate utilization protein A [Metallosphaera javensis (ex Hofmann et al. 2022)]